MPDDFDHSEDLSDEELWAQDRVDANNSDMEPTEARYVPSPDTSDDNPEDLSVEELWAQDRVDADNSDMESTEARHVPSPDSDAVSDTTGNNNETETMDLPLVDDDVPFHLPDVAQLKGPPTHKSLHDEPEVTMPNMRLHSSDPDYTVQNMPHIDSDSNTIANQRVQENPVYRPPQAQTPSPPQQQTPPPPQSEYTMPNPQLAEDRYRRQDAGNVAAQGQYVPPPPAAQQRSLPKRRGRNRRILGLPAGCVWVFLGLMLTFCGGTTMLSLGAAMIFVPRIEAQWTAEIERVDDYEAFQSTFIYDRNGDQLFEVFGEGRRTSVDYQRFPENLINATIAIEDDSFWDNIGIDVPATTVAFFNYLGASSGERTPGGSTITQQLVRNVLFDFEKRAEISASRKAEEIILAILLTQRKSKEDILELYLNEIYYGNLAYGAQTAAQTFFSKDVENLSLGEAALLAGLPQAPVDLDPLNPDPEVQARVFDRQRQVLQEMVEEGYITAEEREAALREGLSFRTPEAPLRAPHFTVYAQSELEDLLTELGYSPEALTQGGFRVYTTVDQDVNDLAVRAARDQINAIRQDKGATNASVVVLKPLTGEILGMAGSIDYNSDTIDGRVNVAIALRQPGSTMKPFTYAAALERGLTAGDVIWDTKTEIGIPGQPVYRPVNYDRSFHGPMTMRTALANSYNIPAVQTLRLVGVDYLLDIMHRFGVTSLQNDPSQYGLSLTLGGGEISLLELTAGYGAFANLGSYVEPTSILCVIDGDDQIIYQYENGCLEGTLTAQSVNRTGFGKQVLDPRIAYLITDILSDNQARAAAIGTRSPLYTPGIESAAKTGTTNDVRDNWTVGYTRNVAVGVWVGNNDNTPMINSSGLAGASPIWNAVITAIHNNSQMLNSFAVEGRLQADKAAPPSGMSIQRICDVRGMRDPAYDCPQMNEWFLDGPAGIPDNEGNLYYPPPQIVDNTPENQNFRQVSPDVFQVAVYPIPEQIAAGISFNIGPGEKQPLPPRYCRITLDQVPQATAAGGAQNLMFIAGPTTSQADYVEAQMYARSNGLPILPMIDCQESLFTPPPPQPPVVDEGPSFGPAVTTALITYPQNGATLSGIVPVMGTAQFTGDQADFYQLAILGGSFTDWTSIGEPGFQPVIDGELEKLYTPAFEPGTYRLRLYLSRHGSGPIQDPYEIQFTVAPQ